MRSHLTLCLTLAAVAGATAVHAATLTPELRPVEIAASSAADPAPGTRAALYPTAARKAGVEGEAVVRCAIRPEGRFGDCATLREYPQGQGFGAAAQAGATGVYQPIPDRYGRPRTHGETILTFLFTLQGKQTQPGDPDGRLIDWEERPTGEDFARNYPFKAVQANIEGDAALACGTSVDGHLTDCRVLYDSPYGWGFDKATLALVPRFRMRPTLKDGSPRPAGMKVRLPIGWRLPKG